MKEELTIIIAARDVVSFIGRCLESVKAQTYRPLHVVIVDNASCDGTGDVASAWAIANHDADFRVSVVSESERSAGAARRRGFAEARSEMVMFFDADDEMRGNLASTVMESRRRHPDADVISWDVCYHSLSGNQRVLPGAKSRLMFNQIVHSVLRTHGYAIRRSFLANAGNWDSSLPVWNDWELGIRLAGRSPVIVHTHKILANIYARQDSLTGTSRSEKVGEWEKALDAAELFLETSDIRRRDYALRLVNYRRMVLASEYRAEGNIADSERLRSEALAKERSSVRRAMLRFAFAYISRGGRGVATVLGPFL